MQQQLTVFETAEATLMAAHMRVTQTSTSQGEEEKAE